MVVETMHKEKLSHEEAERRFELPHNRAVSWERIYLEEGEEGLEVEMNEHLGYEKNSILGNNSGNSSNGYGKKTISSDYKD